MLKVQRNWKFFGIRRAASGFVFVVGLVMQRAWPEVRGVAVTFDGGSGESVDFYRSGSYALLIGVSDYTHGWAKLDTVP